jgi:uncharacterized damage-inducible protein DinB
MSRPGAARGPNSYDSTVSVIEFYEDWRTYNTRLVDRIRPLTREQLDLSSSPSYWPIWAIAAHTAGTRVYWLCGVFKEPGADTTPFSDPLTGEGWEDHLDHPRSASEVAGALEASWKIVDRCLERWTPAMLRETFTRQVGDKIQVHSRRSVLMRMLSHDAFHSGEISAILGAHGLPEIDLWRP